MDINALKKSGWTPAKANDTAKRNLLDALQGTSDVGYRGLLAGLLGSPVDTANLVQNAGREAYNLFADKPVPLSNNPVGGAEWFGGKMQDAGLVSDKRRPLMEALAGFASPDAGDLMKVAAVIPALKAADNLNANLLQKYLTGGKLDADEMAQYENNALKMRDEGKQWFNVDNAKAQYPAGTSRDEMARAIGFDTDAYHGTGSVFSEFNPDAGGGARSNTGNWLSTHPEIANTYAGGAGRSVMPLLVNTKGFGDIDLDGQAWNRILPDSAINHRDGSQTMVDELIDSQYEDFADTNDIARYSRQSGDKGLHFLNALDRGGYVSGAKDVPPMADNMAVFNPSAIRSKFAAFDPLRKDSTDLLASLFLPAMVGGAVVKHERNKRNEKK